MWTAPRLGTPYIMLQVVGDRYEGMQAMTFHYGKDQ
jgi:hypothetical protein